MDKSKHQYPYRTTEETFKQMEIEAGWFNISINQFLEQAVVNELSRCLLVRNKKKKIKKKVNKSSPYLY